MTGVSNKKTLGNIKRIGRYHREREEVPFIRASTLWIPGYVDEEEVKKIAEYLAEIDPMISYSLLAFKPDFEMGNLSYASGKLAFECKAIAEKIINDEIMKKKNRGVQGRTKMANDLSI